jgi:hypothetical protein
MLANVVPNRVDGVMVLCMKQQLNGGVVSDGGPEQLGAGEHKKVN